MQLIDVDLAPYSDVAIRRLQESWAGIFRDCILELMPVGTVEQHFHEFLGRPTKELYSMCGLVFLMDFRDWTAEEAADAYMFDGRVQFALNLGRDRLSMTSRTVERYRALFRKDDCAAAVMELVTKRLVELLGTSVDLQRLDSTHIFSNMAMYGRTRLMKTVVKRFLTQLKRHEEDLFGGLDADLRRRYEKRDWDFGTGGGAAGLVREQIARDMLTLIALFEKVPSVAGRTTFKDLVRCFGEQCELVEGTVTLRKKTGSDALNNPADPDATYDGHKGAGYQVQVSETCGAENDTQLILVAVPQTACEQDNDAVELVLDELERTGNTPATLLADTGYGSDANHQMSAARGVDLVAPVNCGGRSPDRLAIDDFELAGDNTVKCCPVGQVPLEARYDAEKGKGCASFSGGTCSTCENFGRCPVQVHGQRARIKYTAAQLRLARRKAYLATLEGAGLYAWRSGIEGTFSRGKSVAGLGRLRVRGKSAVSMAILLKLAGINILRALGSGSMRKRLAEAFRKARSRARRQAPGASVPHIALLWAA